MMVIIMVMIIIMMTIMVIVFVFISAYVQKLFKITYLFWTLVVRTILHHLSAGLGEPAPSYLS